MNADNPKQKKGGLRELVAHSIRFPGLLGKVALLRSLLLVVELTLLTRGAAADTRPVPVLSIGATQIDFGRVTNGTGTRLEYPLQNNGTADLILSEVLPDCSLCIQATAKPARLKPGQKGILSVEFDFLGQTGALSHAIELESNDPSRPTTLLSFSGEAIRTFQLTPSEIRLRVRRGETNASVLLRSLAPLPAPPAAGTIAMEFLQVSILPVSPTEWRVTVTLSKAAPVGTTRVFLDLPPSGPGDHLRRIPCVLVNPPDIETLPAELRLPDTASPDWTTLWVRQHSASPKELVEVRASSTSIQCEVMPHSGTPNYRIRARTNEGVSRGTAPSSLILRFSGHGGPDETLEIPVRWFPAAHPAP